MKKILYFLSAVCLAVGLMMVAAPKTQVFCDDEPPMVYTLSQGNFGSILPDAAPGSKFLLEQDIVLEDWSPINLDNITIDGNGFTISTDAPLFGLVSNNSIVKNLGVIAKENFVFEGTAETAYFGLIAQNVTASTFLNVYGEVTSVPNVSAEEKAELLQANFYDEMRISLRCSAKVGALFGVLQEGSVVQNAYAKTNLIVTQNDPNALKTIVGGVVGEIGGGVKMTNCYAVPQKTQLISVGFAQNFVTSGSTIYVGGFAGNVTDNIDMVSNVFVGGALPNNSQIENKTVVVGKIVGKIATLVADQFANVYTFNQNAAIGLMGEGSTPEQDVKFLPQDMFTSINNYASNFVYEGRPVWNDLDAWNTQMVWCKKDVSAYPVLQVFQEFYISINTSKNGEGVKLTMQQNGLTLEDEHGSVLQKAFKYNTEIHLHIAIAEEFLPYKIVKNLVHNNTNEVANFKFSDKKVDVSVPIIVNGATSGVYFANSQNITYNLKVISENSNQGNVRVRGATASIDPTRPFDVMYGSTQGFVAVSANNSFTFEKWVWVSEGQEDQDVYVGNQDNKKLAGQNMVIKFGDDSFASDDNTYLLINMNDAAQISPEGELVDGQLFPNVPSQEIDGVITFTLKAKFTTHNETLNILVTARADSASIHVSEIYLDGNEELDGVSFNAKITIGVPVKVTINVAEGYTFKRWRVTNQSLSQIIDAEAGETETSTTIHITLDGATTLYADVVKNEEIQKDLTWLWYGLGGVGGVAAIGTIIALVIRRKRQEQFIDYY